MALTLGAIEPAAKADASRSCGCTSRIATAWLRFMWPPLLILTVIIMACLSIATPISIIAAMVNSTDCPTISSPGTSSAAPRSTNQPPFDRAFSSRGSNRVCASEPFSFSFSVLLCVLSRQKPR
ncbi:hypothetical protein PE067_15870 [Paracoccus sp. DMF-8]|uniref:hypothetical protein n=1 Tax=Paracoccus sp. DMF-8 TaxID=3019445 RepID=UPI0023E43F7C|nr:hypothetical protein [Paracoccus sp. DMF-8]MDF3607485.1 hypothetical protein [Paracoccus sp. DMF-8]